MIRHNVRDGHIDSTGVHTSLGGGKLRGEGGGSGAGQGSARSDCVVARIQPHHLQESGGC